MDSGVELAELSPEPDKVVNFRISESVLVVPRGGIPPH